MFFYKMCLKCGSKLKSILYHLHINMKKVIPKSIENKIPDNRFVYYFAWLLVGFNFFRSLEHIFNEDGGAESIAGIPLSTYSTEAAALSLIHI